MYVKKAIVSIFILSSLGFSAHAVWGQTYYVQPGDSLYSIAARYGTTTSALQSVNGLYSASIYAGQALTMAPQYSSSSSSYIVKPGDSLFLLSQKFGISVATLKQTNNLKQNYLIAGQILSLPISSSSSGSSSSYRVQTGDTLYLIAQKYGVTVANLKQTNGLYADSLWVGQTLRIPTGTAGTNTAKQGQYTVKSGDTLYLIAQRNGILINALCQVNGLGTNSPLFPGQLLKIPQATSSSGGYSYYNYNLSQNDLDLLARIVSAESDGESFNGQVAVASTVLNRLRDPRYPKTLSGVVYQVTDGSYQYSPVLDGRINQPASSSSYQAVQTALTGEDPSKGANGFYNPDKTSSQWVRSQTTTAVIGNHVFFSY